LRHVHSLCTITILHSATLSKLHRISNVSNCKCNAYLYTCIHDINHDIIHKFRYKLFIMELFAILDFNFLLHAFITRFYKLYNVNNFFRRKTPHLNNFLFFFTLDINVKRKPCKFDFRISTGVSRVNVFPLLCAFI